jgi:hypothetical protein
MDAGSSSVLNLTTEDICISFRFKISALPDSQKRVVINKGYVGVGYVVTREVEGAFSFSMNSFTWKIFTSNTYQDGAWHHIAFVIDRDSQSNCKIYVDGLSVSIATEGDLLACTGSQTNSTNLRVGNYTSLAGPRYYDGGFHDLKVLIGGIWTSEQITYQSSHINDTSASAGTITEHYGCQEGSGTDVNATNTTPTNDLTLFYATGVWQSYTATQLKKIAGVAYADVKKVVGVAIASVKKVGGVQ